MTRMKTIRNNIERFAVRDEDFVHRSVLHGRLHTHRVMAWVCVLAELLKFDGEAKLAFFAAMVHDLGRLTDGKEPGHGLSSAENHLPRYRSLFTGFGLSDAEYKTVYDAVRLHSRSDEADPHHPGIRVIHLLKDADGLDRVRLGDDEPDASYLRFAVTKDLIKPARLLLAETEKNRNMTLKSIADRAFELARKA